MHPNAETSHPKILSFLFLTEMWERFGFYIVQGLLVLYLTRFYGFSDDQSFAISGVFLGLVYISPFIGGFLADKLLGFQAAIIWGGGFLVAGYTLLALFNTVFMLYPALAAIIIGNGLLKPNISSLLGTQYDNNNFHRESGFTLFYIGINIGVALSGFSGYVRNAFGWNAAFALAAAGMMIALATFFYGSRYIKSTRTQIIEPICSKVKLQLFTYCILVIIAVSFLLKIHTLAYWLLPSAGLILFIFLIVLTLQQPPEFRSRMIALTILILSSIIFWMLFLQLFNSANLYIDRLVDKNLFGLHLSTTIFYAMESVYIILLGPLFAWAWHNLSRKNKNPSPIYKFVLGIFFAGLGFLVLGVSTYFPNADNLINPLWILFAYLFITIGELFLSPIGLSAVTLLAPPRLIGMMMGIWFAATGFGGLFAGLIATIASVPKTAVTVADKLAIYQNAFFDYALFAFFIAITLLFVNLVVSHLTQKPHHVNIRQTV
jgi:POT family proton-dependent oligopeptide transporter